MRDNVAMSELIAIAHPQLYTPTKRDALLFERFGMLGFRNRPQQEDYHIRAELEWLAERGLAFETSISVVGGDFPSEALPYAEEAFAHTTISASLDIVAADPAKYELLNSQGKLRKRLERLASVHRNVDLAAVARKAHYRLEDILRSSRDLTAAATSATEDALQASARFVSQLHRVVNGYDADPYRPCRVAERITPYLTDTGAGDPRCS
jgi:hypothetical protein